MRTFLLSMAGAFTAMVLFVIVFFAFLFTLIGLAGAEPPKPTNVVLKLDLRTEYPDQAASSGFAALTQQIGFTDVLTKLKSAETDPNVKGLFIRGAQGSVGSARAEELRDAITEFRAAGKYVIAHSQGSFSTGPSSLRAIAAADEIWVQPGTDVTASGVSFETLFMKGLLDNLSIVTEIEALYEYKNAPNGLKETDYTAPHREAMTQLAESLWTASLEDIAADRDLEVETLRGFLETGPMSAETAVERTILDKLGWPEEAEDAAKNRNGNGTLLSIASYTPPSPGINAERIAIVGGEGGIVTGSSGGGNPFAPEVGFASDAIAKSILAAGKNKNVRAIVFRVDSGGGSPTASDQIWRAIERVQEDGTPVVVSMGSVAASGGYYVASGSDYIMASRSTITGSIGIFGGKQTFSGGLERIGINPRTISVGGEYADAYGVDLFSDSQRQALRDSLKRGYDRFTSLVADGRNMTLDEVDTVARGRVWSGEDALAQGLVDEIGGFTDAIEKARELAGIEEGAKIRLVYYPQRKEGIEALEELFGVSADVGRAAGLIGAIAGDERLNAAISQMQLMQNEHVQVIAPIMIEN